MERQDVLDDELAETIASAFMEEAIRQMGVTTQDLACHEQLDPNARRIANFDVSALAKAAARAIRAEGYEQKQTEAK